MPRQNKTQETLAKGIFTKYSTGLLYLNGTIDGITYKDVSTDMKNNKANLTYLKKNKDKALRELVGLKAKDLSPTLVEYGLKVLEDGAKKENHLGLVGKRGRNLKQQVDIIQRWNNHVKPFFKNMKISEIEVSHINQWQSQLVNLKTGKKMADNTIKSIKADLSSVFFTALGDRLVTVNVVEHSIKIDVSAKDRGFYSTEDIKKLLDASEGQFKLILTLLSKSGLRISEAMGLMVETDETTGDIDLERGVINLQRSLNDGHSVATNKEDPNINFLKKEFDPKQEGRVLAYIGSTKNHKRAIVISFETLELVKAHVALLPKRQKFLFVTSYKKPFSGSKNLNKKLKKLCELTGVKYLGLHAFRHSMITMSRAEGIDPQATVGHARGSDVTDRYDHGLLTETAIAHKRAEAEKLEILLGKKEEKEQIDLSDLDDETLKKIMRVINSGKEK